MSATSLFFSGPEMTMTWSGFYTSMKQEAKIGNVAIRCPEISLKGNCCLTCRAAAGELSSLCEEVVVIQHTDEKVQCQDIASLRYQLWKEASKQGGKERCRGLVLILHDFSMESGRACRNTAPRLLAEGYAVAGFDLRGHGKSSDRSDSFDATQSLRRFFSGSRRVVVDGDDCWIQMQRWRSDIMTVVRRACQDIDAEQSLPVYLFGDGFGAAMAIEFVASSQASLMKDLHIRGVAASGALLGLNNGASFKETYKYLDSMRNSKVLADKYIIFPADLDDLSRDLRVGEMVRKDQLRLKQADALMLKAAIRVVEKASKCTSEPTPLPVAFFHGTEDACAPLDAVETFVAKANSKNVTCTTYEQSKHWLHHEILPERDSFLDDLVQWLRDLQ